MQNVSVHMDKMLAKCRTGLRVNTDIIYFLVSSISGSLCIQIYDQGDDEADGTMQTVYSGKHTAAST